MTRGDVQVEVLGPIQVVRSGQSVELGGRRQRTVLAALVVDAGSVVSADELTERVWGDEELPADPRASLRTYLSRLRQSLGLEDAITAEQTGWRLAGGALSIDAVDFEALVGAAEEPGVDAHERVALLDQALGRWRGSAYDDLAPEPWVRAEAERLEELRLTAIERRFDAMLAAGKHTDALPGLTAACETEPNRDRLVGLRMLALYRSGRHVEATRVFQQHRDRLSDELGLEPGQALVELDRRIVASDPSLLLDESIGRPLRGYRLGEQLGQGAFAVVFRGSQPSLGRDVAVKIIRPELANRPEFVRRFEAEAHLVARLEHPHIVPLYDYWREPDRACLVFRYLRGGTLESRLTASGGLTPDEALLLVDQVGSALAVAHRAGVVHRDVKPANVFCDDNGHFYLGDFGIALEAAELSDPTAALSAGSPAYASPEQLRREPIGPPADVHGLGITLYEALTGLLPFPSARSQADLLRHQLNDPIPPVSDRRPDLPPAIDQVVARATIKQPADRYQSIEELVAEFRAAIGGPSMAAPTIDGRAGVTTALSAGEAANPYKGLRAFDEADAGEFFGRERLVERLIAGLDQTGPVGRIAAVVGPSGIGKSSVVRAGLLPALRRGAVAGSDSWFLATMLPGSDPFQELASALLRVATSVPDNLMGQLTEDTRGIARVVKALAPDNAQILVVIDQFEELFTQVDDPSEVRRFLDALEHAVSDARCPLRVVLTMRADFWDRPLRHGSFARLIESSTVAVTALAPDELERAITEPAHRTGAEFEPGLVSEIVADVADQPGALPLLQYALTELWEHRISGLLTRDAYRELGGVAGALTRRAEDLFAAASPEEQSAVRQVFGRLVTPGEGTEDTRRRAMRTEVVLGSESETVVDRFGQARLLSFDTDPATREPTVEVAHEALIRGWPRLRDWLDEDRDDIRLHRHLRAAALDWDRSGRPEAELYRGGRLEAAEQYAGRDDVDLDPIEVEFLAAGVWQREKEAAADRERLDAQVRNNRRLQRLLVGAASLLVFALAAGGIALQQRQVADSRADELARQVDVAALARDDAIAARSDADLARVDAETRRLIADAEALTDENPTLALLLAAQAARRESSPRTTAGLHQVLTSFGPLLGTLADGENVVAAEWLDDDRVGVVFGRTLAIYDVAAGTTPDLVALPGDPELRSSHPFSRVPSPLAAGAGVVAVAIEGGQVAVFDGRDSRLVSAASSAISSIAVTGDGQDLVVADSTGMLSMIDLTTDRAVWTTVVMPETSLLDAMTEEARAFVESLEGTTPLDFDDLYFGSGPLGIEELPDGSLAVAAGVHVRRVGRQDGRLLAEHLLESEVVPGAPDLPRWARGLDQAADGTLHVELGLTPGWVEIPPDFGPPVLRNGDVARLFGTEWLADLTVSPSGDVWFANLLGRYVQVVDGDPSETVSADLSELRHLRVSPDGRELLLIGDGGVRRRSLVGDQILAQRVPLPDQTTSLSVSASGLIVVDAPGRSGLVQVGDGVPRAVELPDQLVGRSLWSGADPLDRFISAWGPDCCPFELIDKSSLAPTGLSLDDVATGEAFSHDGRSVALGASGPTVRVYELETGRQISPDLDLRVLTGVEAATNVSSLAFSQDDKRLFAAIRGGTVEVPAAAVIFDTDTWEVLFALDGTDDGGATSGVYASTGELVTVGTDGRITVRDSETLASLRSWPGGPEVANVFVPGPFVSSDGEYLLTLRHGPRLWHLPSGSLIGAFPHDPEVGVGGTAGDRHLSLVTALDGGGLVWSLDVDSWLDLACRAAGRSMTREEWEAYGPQGDHYQATCPDWPTPD